MASSISRANNWIKKQALWGQQAHLNQKFPGISFTPNRPLTGKETALNLTRALYYHSRSLILGDLVIYEEPALNLLPAQVGPPEVARSKRPAHLDVPYLLAASQNGASGSGSTVRDKILAFILTSEHKVVSLSELAFGTKLGEEAVEEAVRELMAQPARKISMIEDFVYPSGLDNFGDLLSRAKDREEKRWAAFLNAIHATVRRIEELQQLKEKPPVHEVIRIINEVKDKLGIRWLDILLRNQEGSDMSLFQQDVLPGGLRKGVKDSLFEQISSDAKPYVYDLRLPKENRGGRYRKVFEENGLAWDARIADALVKRSIERLIILKGLSYNKEEAQVQLVLTNPVFFGKDKDKMDSVIVELNRLAKAAGRTIGWIRGVGDGSQRSSDPEPLAKEFFTEFWNELKQVNGRKRRVTFSRPGRKTKALAKVIKDPDRSLSDEMKKALFKVLRSCSLEAWKANIKKPISGYTDEYILEHFVKVEKLILVADRKTKEVIGFMGLKKRNVQGRFPYHLIEVGMVHYNHQALGVASYMNRVLLGEALIESHLVPYILATRTANPIAIGGYASNMSECYPDPLQRTDKAPLDFRAVAQDVAQYLCPENDFDPESFVIQEVYAQDSGMIYELDTIPNHRDPKVNSFVREKLGLEDRKGNAFVFVGRFDAGIRDAYDKKLQKNKRLDWMTRLALRMFRT